MHNDKIRDVIMGAARLHTHDHGLAFKITEEAMLTIAVEQVRASEWPTEAMIDAAELKMPDLGRLQIRFLFETMVAAACGSAAEQVREREVVPLGWKLVPIEPDDYMKMEGANLLRSIPENSAEYRAGHCYRAMLSATPVISD